MEIKLGNTDEYSPPYDWDDSAEGECLVVIAPRDDAKIGRVIEELGNAVLENHNDQASIIKLLAIEDPRTVPFFRQLVEKKNRTARFYALRGLGKFDSDEALQGIEVGLATSAADMRPNTTTDKLALQSAHSIHNSAANAFSNSPDKEKVPRTVDCNLTTKCQ